MEANDVIKTYPCTIRESWYGSLETAYIDITTPKGTSLRIDKWPPAKLKNKWTENETVAKLVWDIYGRCCEEQKKSGKYNNIIHLTKAEIMLIKDYSDRQGEDLTKKMSYINKAIQSEWSDNKSFKKR